MEISRTHSEDLPFVIKINHQGKVLLERETVPVRRAGLCPACLKGYLNYNGLLTLECSECRYSVGGCFT